MYNIYTNKMDDVYNPMTDKNKIINRAESRLQSRNLEKYNTLPNPRDKIPPPPPPPPMNESVLTSPFKTPSIPDITDPSEMKSHIVLISKDGTKANIVYINTGNNKYVKYTKNGENYNDDKKTYIIKLEESFSGGKKTKRNRKKKTHTKTNRKR